MIGQEESQARKRMMEPNQCPVTSEEVDGTIMDTRIDIPDRCRDRDIQMGDRSQFSDE